MEQARQVSFCASFFLLASLTKYSKERMPTMDEAPTIQAAQQSKQTCPGWKETDQNKLASFECI